jgi:DNA-binding transcriptional regulator YdaS (Cro superfamily)
MTLASWRTSQDPKLTLAAAAQLLGIGGSNPARTYQRYETGENAVDARLAGEIVRRTDGAVTYEDLANIRAAWMRLNTKVSRRGQQDRALA